MAYGLGLIDSSSGRYVYSVTGIQTFAVAALVVLGAYHIGYKAYRLLRTLLSLFVLPGKKITSFGPRGSWALITGASDGIGKEYALQLAKAGYNIILVSRTASKLDALASTITSTSTKTPILVETLAMDFGANNDADYARLGNVVSDKDIAILINNVGQSHSIPVPFAETPEAEIRNIVTINCTATLRVTQLVLPGMLQRKRGLVLSMGSFGGLLPTPLLATYSGSKAFLQQWSNALASEVAPQGVTVHLVHSYLVTSAMSKIRRSSWMVPSEKLFVKCVLGKIGRTGGSVGYAYSGSPYPSHGLIAWAILTISGAFTTYVSDRNRRVHIGIRKKALRKQEEKAKANKAL